MIARIECINRLNKSKNFQNIWIYLYWCDSCWIDKSDNLKTLNSLNQGTIKKMWKILWWLCHYRFINFVFKHETNYVVKITHCVAVKKNQIKKTSKSYPILNLFVLSMFLHFTNLVLLTTSHFSTWSVFLIPF